MKLLIKALPLVSALLVSTSLSAQTTSPRVPLTFVPFDTDGDGVLNETELAERSELNGSALILRIYDLNGDGTIDSRSERLNFSGTFRALRALTIEDFPQLPILGIPISLLQFDVDDNGILDREEKANASSELARVDRRAEIQELAELFNITRGQVRQVRRFLRSDSPTGELAPELEPVRDEILARRAARRAQTAADRAALLNSVDFDRNGSIEFSEFLALPATRGILSSRPDRLITNLQVQLGAFVRRDLNGDQSLELSEFTLNTGNFLGE